MSTDEKPAAENLQRHHPAADGRGEKFRKYSFDTDFFEIDVDDNAAVAHLLGSAPGTADNTPKGPTAEDLAQAESRGYSAGLADGKAQAEEHVQQLIATHLQPLIEQLSALEEARQEYLQLAGSQSLHLLRHLLKKFLEDAAKNYGDALLEQSLTRALHEVVGDTPLRVTIHPSTRETLLQLAQKRPELEKLTKNMKLESSTTLQPGDCRVEWATGGLDARLTTALQEVDKLLAAAQAEALNQEAAPKSKKAGSKAAEAAPTDAADTVDEAPAEAAPAPAEEKDPA